MKESITKFDLESAFKALEEIEIPKAGKVQANRPALTEIFSQKTKFDSLMEEYYDVSDTAELDNAKDAREAEVAKAKLARIEKIVDLDADSPEDLLASYVGKYIMQCPQCMTLFYKDSEDIIKDENDPETVNVNEICQHCGNEAGYTLVGKVGEATPDEMDEFTTDLAAEEPGVEDLPVEEPTDDEDFDIDLEAIDLDDEEPAEEVEEESDKQEEAFITHTGEALVEELTDDKDLDAKLAAHSEYIEYLRNAISQEEAALEKATNDQIKIAIQRNITAFKLDLENALPDAVKNDIDTVEEPENSEMPDESEKQEESFVTNPENVVLTEELHEDTSLEISDEEFEELINSPEFKKPISDSETKAILNAEKDSEESEKTEEELEPKKENLDTVMSNLVEVHELALETYISTSLVEAYGNVSGFKLTECSYLDNKFNVNGTIYFNSGKTRPTTYSFSEAVVSEGKISMFGLNEKLGLDKQFALSGYTDDNKTFITETFTYAKK